MPVDFSTQVYFPAFNVFARKITVYPLMSQPGERPYDARGIFGTEPIDVAGMDGTIISDQRTILDIREAEFSVLLAQRDQIFIPADGPLPEEGMFEVNDVRRNGGGETTLSLRRVVQAEP
jgi:hypothetical protein